MFNCHISTWLISFYLVSQSFGDICHDTDVFIDPWLARHRLCYRLLLATVQNFFSWIEINQIRDSQRSCDGFGPVLLRSRHVCRSPRSDCLLERRKCITLTSGRIILTQSSVNSCVHGRRLE